MWQRWAIRFGGVEGALSTTTLRLANAASDHDIRTFFTTDLPTAVDLARRNPTTATRFFTETTPRVRPPFWNIAAIACGNASAILPAMDEVDRAPLVDHPLIFTALDRSAKARPYEVAHLLRRLFTRADLELRLQILERFTTSPLLGDRRSIEELFTPLMARTTPAERRDVIYPRLTALLTQQPLDPRAQFKWGWLGTMFSGWMKEAKDLEHST